MKRLPEFRERGNLGARTMLCRPKNQGEKKMLVLKLEKKDQKNLFPISQVTKLPVRRFLWTSPPPSVWFQTTGFGDFKQSWPLILIPYFKSLRSSWSFKLLHSERKEELLDDPLLTSKLEKFQVLSNGTWLQIISFLWDLDLIMSKIQFGISSRPQEMHQVSSIWKWEMFGLHL